MVKSSTQLYGEYNATIWR